MTKRPRIIISKELQSLDIPIRLPPMKANKLFMSMAFLLEKHKQGIVGVIHFSDVTYTYFFDDSYI